MFFFRERMTVIDNNANHYFSNVNTITIQHSDMVPPCCPSRGDPVHRTIPDAPHAHAAVHASANMASACNLDLESLKQADGGRGEWRRGQTE